MGTLLAIDGTGLLVRCSRAARFRPLESPSGMPTAALTMFVNSLALKIRQEQPSHVVLAWDGPHATLWRRTRYSGYKAGVPDTWMQDVEVRAAAEFCRQAGIFQMVFTMFEADDVLAAVTRAAMSHMPGEPTVVCSDDEDMHQLADDCPDHPVVIRSQDGKSRVTAEGVRVRWGVRPLWLPQVRALAGDKSDGIPGLPGVGPAKALKMLRDVNLNWARAVDGINDPYLRELAVTWRDIIDLVIPVRSLEDVVGVGVFRDFAQQSRWDPETGQNALDTLQSYGMTQIAERLAGGRLW